MRPFQEPRAGWAQISFTGDSMKMTISKLLTALAIGLAGIPAFAAFTDYGSVTLPFSQPYGRTFSASETGNFSDSYQFSYTAPVGTFNTVSVTIDLAGIFQITGLQARLYQGMGPFTSGSTPMVQGWTTPLGSGEVTVIHPVALAANTYTLEIRGNVVGTAGGSYGGALNIAVGDVTAVPEPGAYMLMFSGLALIGGMVVRRRKMA